MNKSKQDCSCHLTDGFNLTLLFDGERRWKQNQLFKNRHDVEVEIPAKAQMTPVVCIPVVLRKVSYIEQTLKSLFNNLSDSVRDEVLFVVMFAFPNITTYSFKKLSSSVSAISPIWYEEDMESIIPSFNDSKERMYWRTKQNLGDL
ncbi:hypothetical protein NECAME_15793 [Necator americanus]|uniref:Uncharacterized protein n=1 Tax=Necator americanus TaxID=51031 RepID=W2SFS9_NECAM|nr:hypothetical protein NECAME_15793 [Necator americanus]ETN68474.1 hypothetical protein NECAME_15793 [Necator americanus]